MQAITIDMVGSALKKPAQTRVRNPIKSLSDLSPAQLSAAEKKADLAHSKLIDEMIEKGRGHERPTETRGKSDDLSKRFMASLNHSSDIAFEKRRRMEYHGSLRAVKKNPIGPAAKTPKKPARRPMPITPNRGKNPAKKLPKTLYNGVLPFRYVVEKADTRTAKWSPLASFAGKSDAVAWANDYAKQNRIYPVRVFDREE